MARRGRMLIDTGRSSATDPDEALISEWFAAYVGSGRAKVRFPLTRPRSTLRTVALLRRLPALLVPHGTTPDHVAIRRAMHRPLIVRIALAGAVSALAVPADPAEYLRGRPKHALRQGVRAADRAGVRYRRIDEPTERASLAEVAAAYERGGAVEGWRNAGARTEQLIPLAHWLLAEASDGTPLLLAVAAIADDTAVLTYYRTLEASDRSSAARFGAMPPLVEALAAAGVRWLAEAGPPHWTHNGVRQFQRKVGFRIVRSRVLPPTSARS